MLIILIFISVVFAPLPPPTHNALPETFIQLSVNSQFIKTFSPLWTKLKAILNLREIKTNALPEPPKIKLSTEQLMQKLNVLSALPDDIQVKIILDTQNAQNAIQWLKMNKESADKLFKDPKFPLILSRMFRLSIMDKYYDADILKRILNYPNLVNWDINAVETDVQYVMGIYKFVTSIKDVDLSSAAGRQIHEYALLNIAKSIGENPGKSTDLLLLDYSDILVKIMQSDAALTKKFTNDLSLADSYMVGKLIIKAGYLNKINVLKLILENPKVTEAIPLVYVQRGIKMAILYNNNDFFTATIEDPIISSRLDINDLFKEANENINMFALQKIINTPELFAKVSEDTVNCYFDLSKKPNHLKFFLENSHLSQQIDSKTFERKIGLAIIFQSTKEVSILLEATNVWKDMKFSLKLKNAYNIANDEMKQIIDKNELFKNKIDEIEG